MKKEYADYLIKKTTADYNNIAEQFSSTRNYLPDDIKDLKKYIKKKDEILDFGCGNGVLLEIIDDKSKYTGIDQSVGMIKSARINHPNTKFQLISNGKVPANDNKFNLIFSLACLHHIPINHQKCILEEFKRVLAPNGKVIITVWYLRRNPNDYIRIILSRLRNRNLCWGDLFIPFRNGTNSEIFASRYVHAFSKRELGKLAKSAGFYIKKSVIIHRGKNQNILMVLEI